MKTTKKMLITCLLVTCTSLWLAAQTCSTGYCPSTITVHHKVGTLSPQTTDITYGVVASSLSGTASCWITRNLGATVEPAAFADATVGAMGWFFQFDRKQGFKPTTINLLTAAATAPVALAYYTANTNSLPANDPCTLNLGPAWRLPTRTEMGTIFTTVTTGNLAFASPLKMNMPGDFQSTLARYWILGDGGYLTSTSSTVISCGSHEMQAASISSWTPQKDFLFPVRCLKLQVN
jgi:hypothetical protein